MIDQNTLDAITAWIRPMRMTIKDAARGFAVLGAAVMEYALPRRTRSGRWRVALQGPNGLRFRVYRTRRLAGAAFLKSWRPSLEASP
jgi:hypothetical protein